MTISNIEMHNRISRQLENSHSIIISPTNEWFKQCVDFFMSDNPNCNANDLSSMVVEQLSLADFQQIGLSSLPANLHNCVKTVLRGKYCLQVNTILDVGQSCYSQYNIILKRDTSNAEIGDTKPAPWEPKLHRMLKMTCTDGQQDIMAMEYEPLVCLKEPFVPGFKIAIIGPVEYRKGVLLLKSNNVRFIGGEVDHLLIKNAPLNVLCRALNKPELENPYKFSSIEVENTEMEVQELPVVNPPRQIENINSVNSRPQNSMNSQNSSIQNNNRTGSGGITYDDFFDGDDEDLLYLTQVAEMETGIAQSNNLIDYMPQSTFDTRQQNTGVNKPIQSVPKNSVVEKKKTTTVRQTKLSDMLGPSTSSSSYSNNFSTNITTGHNIERNNVVGKQTSSKREASSPVHAQTKRPSTELHGSLSNSNNVDMDTVMNPLVKTIQAATFIKNSKIQIKQNEWICSGMLLNGTKQEEVEFSSEVLERLTGLSPKEVLQCKNNPLNCAPLKEKVEKGIKSAYRKLHLYNDRITLTYSADGIKKPLVIDMVV